MEVGLFDESFKYPFREDSDLAFRVLDKGYWIAYQESALVYHPVRELKLKDFVKIIKYHSYDVLLFKKHPLRSRNLLEVCCYKFTTAGVAFVFNIMLIILFYLTFPVLTATFLVLLNFLLNTYVLFMLKKFSKSISLKERLMATLWHELYILCTVLGHIIGSVKFKTFLL
jgi:GT2 family glycosyltransferase